MSCHVKGLYFRVHMTGCHVKAKQASILVNNVLPCLENVRLKVNLDENRVAMVSGNN